VVPVAWCTLRPTSLPVVVPVALVLPAQWSRRAAPALAFAVVLGYRRRVRSPSRSWRPWRTA